MIHPVLEDPDVHLSIDGTGIFTPKTGRGKACVKIFGLNQRQALVEYRKEAYDDTKDKVIALATALHDQSPDVPKRVAKLLDIKMGKRAYTAAARSAIQQEMEVLGPFFRLLGVIS